MNHRGYSLFEVMVALVLLGAAAVTLPPLLAGAARGRKAAEERQIALAETANVLERVARRPWSQVMPDALKTETISPAAQERLQSARLEIDVTVEPAEPASKRIGVALFWKDRTGRELTPARLTTWIYQPKEPK